MSFSFSLFDDDDNILNHYHHHHHSSSSSSRSNSTNRSRSRSKSRTLNDECTIMTNPTQIVQASPTTILAQLEVRHQYQHSPYHNEEDNNATTFTNDNTRHVHNDINDNYDKENEQRNAKSVKAMLRGSQEVLKDECQFYEERYHESMRVAAREYRRAMSAAKEDLCRNTLDAVRREMDFIIGTTAFAGSDIHTRSRIEGFRTWMCKNASTVMARATTTTTAAAAAAAATGLETNYGRGHSLGLGDVHGCGPYPSYHHSPLLRDRDRDRRREGSHPRNPITIPSTRSVSCSPPPVLLDPPSPPAPPRSPSKLRSPSRHRSPSIQRSLWMPPMADPLPPLSPFLPPPPPPPSSPPPLPQQQLLDSPLSQVLLPPLAPETQLLPDPCLPIIPSSPSILSCHFSRSPSLPYSPSFATTASASSTSPAPLF